MNAGRRLTTRFPPPWLGPPRLPAPSGSSRYHNRKRVRVKPLGPRAPRPRRPVSPDIWACQSQGSSTFRPTHVAVRRQKTLPCRVPRQAPDSRGRSPTWAVRASNRLASVIRLGSTRGVGCRAFATQDVFPELTSERVPYSQAGRMMAVETRLGADVLLLIHLEIDERINALFEIEAAVKAQRDDLQAGDLVGSIVDSRRGDQKVMATIKCLFICCIFFSTSKNYCSVFVYNYGLSKIVVFNQPVDQCGKEIIVTGIDLIRNRLNVNFKISKIGKEADQPCGCPNPAHKYSVYFVEKKTLSMWRLIQKSISFYQESKQEKINENITLEQINYPKKGFYQIDFTCG